MTESKQLSRRSFLRLAGGAVGVAALAACTPAMAPGGGPCGAIPGQDRVEKGHQRLRHATAASGMATPRIAVAARRARA